MYLPDYIGGGINILRDTFGQAWFHANWGYEESKHALSLREYLTRSGQRTSEQMFAYEKAVLAEKWEPPFMSPRQMSFYGAIQEQATVMMYKHRREWARTRGNKVLDTIEEQLTHKPGEPTRNRKMLVNLVPPFEAIL